MVLEEKRPTLGLLLRSTYDALAREVYGRLAQAGYADVRPAHSAVFRHLPNGGARTVDLAALAGMRKQSMGALVDDLEALGYLESSPDPGDRRAKVVRLSERGRAARATIEGLSAEVEARWSSEMGGEEWAAMRGTLERLARSLRENEPQWRRRSPAERRNGIAAARDTARDSPPGSTPATRSG